VTQGFSKAAFPGILWYTIPGKRGENFNSTFTLRQQRQPNSEIHSLALLQKVAWSRASSENTCSSHYAHDESKRMKAKGSDLANTGRLMEAPVYLWAIK